jgi:hypothetical protein
MKYFEKNYPSLTAWIRDYHGLIEIGRDDTSNSMVRVLNPSGLVCETGHYDNYESIDAALWEADIIISEGLPPEY